MNRRYWYSLSTAWNWRDYLTLICIVAICIAIVFALNGWVFDLAWAWEIFGVIAMAIGVAVMACAPAAVDRQMAVG
jgi:hypothetical protein